MRVILLAISSVVVCLFSLITHAYENGLEVYSIASYSESGSQLYIAGIYVKDKNKTYASPAELIQDAQGMGFKITRSRMSSKSWGRGLIQQASINGDDWEFRKVSPYLAEFLGLLNKPFVEGDFVQLVKTGDAVHFYLNGTKLGSEEYDGLFEMLLGAWLGHIPPSSEFKNALMHPELSFAQRLRFEHQLAPEEAKGRADDWVEDLEFESLLSSAKP